MKNVVAAYFVSVFLAFGLSATAAELVRLSAETWSEYAPQGKEVDCIYGDFVLRNDQLIAVIGNPVRGRHANMTVKNVGGAIIDLTRRQNPNDQLSAYYPCASRYTFTDAAAMNVSIDGQPAMLNENKVISGQSISVEFTGDVDPKAKEPRPRVALRYVLSDGEPFLHVETVHNNPTDKPIDELFVDAIRADRVFRFGTEDRLFETSPAAKRPHNCFWATDEWFGQSYGVVCDGRDIRLTAYDRPQLELMNDGSAKASIPPGEKVVISRKIFPGATLFDVRAIAQDMAGAQFQPIEIRVTDPEGSLAHALVAIDDLNGQSRAAEKSGQGEKTGPTPPNPQPIEKTYPKASYGVGRTDASGKVRVSLPAGEWGVTIRATGYRDKMVTVDTRHLPADKPSLQHVELEAAAAVVGRITDEHDRPIPAKVEFIGKQDTPDPFFGPDTAEASVHNLHYTHSGSFRQPIAPGTYEVIISHGPEHDAVFTELMVRPGEETPLIARLRRSVDTRGWVSTDYHSHSTPSGDNVSSQTGRVLNLLCEHIEFAPCTEHNRIDTYLPILKRLNIEHLMATCSGMELTGAPLPVNHQNAFPLVYKPRTQNNGGLEPHVDPVVQIERLALWDSDSEKLVQGNHPNLPQILGDRDLNGEADDGFRKMFGFMDVVEVHPPDLIFSPPKQVDITGKAPRNPIFHWMQMLNLGFRIPGVVNTDAHYNFHGSGWLRNYVKSSTDDPAKIETMEMVRQSEAGHIIVTNGPFLEVSARAIDSTGGAASASSVPKNESSPANNDSTRKGAALPGDDLSAPGGRVSLSIRVQCPNWLDINRVQVFLNGRPAAPLNFTRRDGAKHFRKETVRFEATLPVELTQDTHLIVAAAGEGLQVGRVMGPVWGKKMPVAVSNPIFVDVDGQGFRPNGDQLDVPLPLPAAFRPQADRGTRQP